MPLNFVNAVFIFFFLEKCKAEMESNDPVAVTAAEGGMARLPCFVRPELAGSTITVLTWHKDNSTIYSVDWRHGTPPASDRGDRRYRYEQAPDAEAGALAVRPVRRDDAGLYRCRVDFHSSRSRDTYVQLQVVEKPSYMVLLSGNGTKLAGGVAGPYREGDDAVLVCIVFEGEPLPNVTWWHGVELLDETWTQFSLRRVRNELRLGALRRRHHARRYTCRAHNSDLFAPLEADVTIDMILEPKSVKLYAAEGPVRPGPLQLQCQILGARPRPLFVWMLGDTQLDVVQDVMEEPNGRGDLSTATVHVAAEHDRQNITCCAERQAAELERMCSASITLSVYYAPVVRLTIDGEAANESATLLGNNLTIACNITANPGIFDFRWYFNDEVIKSSGEGGEQDSSCPVLALQKVTSAMAGAYRCSATNKEGLGVSHDLRLQVHYSPHCVNPEVLEYGLGSTDSVNITCNVSADPPADTYRWLYVNTTLNASDSTPQHCSQLDVTQDNVLQYELTEEHGYGTVLCWGENDVSNGSAQAPEDACYFSITDLSVPRPPVCVAVRMRSGDLVVSCQKGHDGGLPQKFTLTLLSGGDGGASEEPLMSVSALEPALTAREPPADYLIVVVAHNDKGSTEPVVLTRDDVIDESHDAGPRGVVGVDSVSTLLLALGGGVGAVVLVACALVMGARERRSDAGSAAAPRARSLRRRRPSAPAGYATDESNCDTCQESEGGSESSFRRSESFHRAVAAAARGGSFRACAASPPARRAACRVHSLQNICGAAGEAGRRRDAERQCDHLLLHLPADLPNYSIPKPPVPFYTMPRKGHLKVAPCQESCGTQNFDSLPLPPPPDEFHTFRSATEILNKECPVTKPPLVSTSYMNVASKSDGTREYNNVIISPMNTVGLPSSTAASALYTYPEDEPHKVDKAAHTSSQYYACDTDPRF